MSNKREEAILAYHKFRDDAVNQTLTLLFGNDVELRARSKDTLASLFDMGANEQTRRAGAASIDRVQVVREAFEKVKEHFEHCVRDREKKQLWISEAYRSLDYALEAMEVKK